MNYFFIIITNDHDQMLDYFKVMNCCTVTDQVQGKSSHRCFSKLNDMILNSAENGKHMDMILIDLQKAFDN